MNFILNIGMMAVLALTVGCSSKSKSEGTTDDYKVAETGSGYEYYSVNDMYFIGPQPTAENIKEFKSDLDIGVVINLRSRRENKKLDFDPKKVSKSVGIAYHNIPLMKRGAPSDMAMAKIEKIIMQNDGKRVLLHCSSGNRAAAWYAAYMAKKTRMTTDAAIENAKKVGLRNKKLKMQLSSYFEKNNITETAMAESAETPAEEGMKDEMSAEGGEEAEATMDEALEPPAGMEGSSEEEVEEEAL